MSPLPGAPRARPRWYVELPGLAVGYVVFGLARAALDRGDPAATANARSVQGLERSLRIAVEHPLNHAVLAHPAAMTASGWFYRLCLLAVPVTLLWLWLVHPARYRPLRTVLVVATLVDLAIVWAFPDAPPRFAQPGIVDYLATRDILGGAATRRPRPGVNLLAAMPSMHVAWTTWCAYAVWSALPGRRPGIARGAGLVWLLPLVTALVVLVTGHHYVLDVVAALVLVAVAALATRALRA